MYVVKSKEDVVKPGDVTFDKLLVENPYADSKQYDKLVQNLYLCYLEDNKEGPCFLKIEIKPFGKHQVDK